MNKPVFKSLTVWSAVVFAALQAAEKQGLVPEGGAELLANLVQGLATFGVFYGIRRAI